MRLKELRFRKIRDLKLKDSAFKRKRDLLLRGSKKRTKKDTELSGKDWKKKLALRLNKRLNEKRKKWKKDWKPRGLFENFKRLKLKPKDCDLKRRLKLRENELKLRNKGLHRKRPSVRDWKMRQRLKGYLNN